MDFTKLFLGEVLEGFDLGGLSKLGFKVDVGGFSDQGSDSADD